MGVAGLGNIRRLTMGTARKWTRQSGKIAASPDRNRDSVELGGENTQTTSKEEYIEERYIEVNGRRFSVSDEIAALHERVKALNQMRVMMEAAEQSAEAARQQTKVLAEQAKPRRKRWRFTGVSQRAGAYRRKMRIFCAISPRRCIWRQKWRL